MNYSVNLIPEEYIGKSAAARGKMLALCLFTVLMLILLAVIYIYMLAATADNHRDIQAYRQRVGQGETAAPAEAEIKSRRREYEDRLKIIRPLHHRPVTAAGITDNLMKATPPGVLLEGIEVKNKGPGEIAVDSEENVGAGSKVGSEQTVAIAGMSPSLEPVGIYLSEVQGITVLKDVLLKEAVWDNGCYRFIIMAVIAAP